LIHPKKKLLEKCFPLFKTSEECVVQFKGHDLRTDIGVVKVKSLKNTLVS